MRVQRPVPDAVQEVLAARRDAVHRRAAEVDGGGLRHAQFEPGDLAPCERLVEPLRRPEDRVALRHARGLRPAGGPGGPRGVAGLAGLGELGDRGDQARAASRAASPAVSRRSVSPRGDSTKPASRSACPAGDV